MSQKATGSAVKPSFMLSDFTTSILADMSSSVCEDDTGFANTSACWFSPLEI